MSLFFLAAASNVGVNFTHGSHHGAQKSTITNSFSSIVFLKLSFVNVTKLLIITPLSYPIYFQNKSRLILAFF